MQRIFFLKKICAKEVILNSVDVANALVQYISENFITDIVLGACSRSPIARAFKNTDISSYLGNSASDTCSVYAISKVRVLKLKSVSQPFTPNSSRKSPHSRCSPDIPACEDFHQHASREQECSSNLVNSNREYQQTTTTERHFGIGTPPDNNSEYLTPRESFYSCKNSLPQQSETTSFASVHSSVTGSTEFMYMTPPNGQPGNMISSPQKPVVDLNIRVQSKQGLSHSTFESFLHLDLQSFQSSDTSELPDQSHTLDASMSSTSFQEAQIKKKYNAACKETVTAREKVREIDQWPSDEAFKLEVKDAQKAAMDMVEREKQKCKAAVEIAQKAQRIAALESEK
ncbi:Hypothetical predicted protein [Olea europaea subsp. europaea]|uniref:RING-type E3 ubiquitin transferase n=1 Tax=Olea europaea subsp. europaea TaxID=158383 RepID=A0A8S0QHK2_OLEEU|nr:Hypothetical predicted protein [Olea europaea subsp. europaea]